MSSPSPQEVLRCDSLLGMLPKQRRNILEIGARNGFITERLAAQFESVTALDLEKPSFHFDRVILLKGDVQRLDCLEADSFDCVLCSEVLEHVPDVAAAARELIRVARHEILVGVPYRQDTRLGQLTCVHCGRVTPPYGHLNRFDEPRLRTLFAGVTLIDKRLVGQTVERTNALSAWLQNLAGNPYGSYDQEEPCVRCKGKLTRPDALSFSARVLAAGGVRLQHLQMKFNSPQPIWIHCLFRKN